MHYLKYKDIYNKTPIKKSLFSYRNEVRGILRNSDGSIAQDTGWVKNMFTTLGINSIGNGNWFRRMGIGSGGGVGNPAMTSFETVLADAVQANSSSRVNLGAPTYVFEEVVTARFLAGVGVGTIREVGLHLFAGTSAGNLTTRAVVPDIVKNSSQVLDMYYKIICTPDLDDTTGTLLIGGVNYNYTVRLNEADKFVIAAVNLVPSLSSHVFSPNVLPAVVGEFISGGVAVNDQNVVVDGAARTIDFQLKADLNVANFTLPGGVKTAKTRLSLDPGTGAGGLAVGFEAIDGPNIGEGIPKTNTDELIIDWSMSWAAP